eukprot:Skav205742  [mRNA]  locus=scaffold1496:347182:348936:- [translate_table: standard]
MNRSGPLPHQLFRLERETLESEAIPVAGLDSGYIRRLRRWHVDLWNLNKNMELEAKQICWSQISNGQFLQALAEVAT